MSNMITKELALTKTIRAIKTLKIDYWVTVGTLLGIIRENRLLPWDDDIDFGVWKSEIELDKLISTFTKNGFQHVSVLQDDDAVKFVWNDISIDISLYTESQTETFVQWSINPSGIVLGCVLKFINAIFEYHAKTIFDRQQQKNSSTFFKQMIGIVSCILDKRIREKLYSFARRKYIKIGCTYPNNIFKTKVINFNGTSVNVPIKHDEFLERTYGINWKIPNADYIWNQDTKNLKIFN